MAWIKAIGCVISAFALVAFMAWFSYRYPFAWASVIAIWMVVMTVAGVRYAVFDDD